MIIILPQLHHTVLSCRTASIRDLDSVESGRDPKKYPSVMDIGFGW